MKILGLSLALILAFCPVGAEVLTGHVVGVTAETEPDDASMVIMRAFRDRLRADLPKIH